MSANAESKPKDRVVALEKKIADLEQNWSRLKWAAGIIGLAVVIVTGYGFIDIPRQAVAKVNPIVDTAVKNAVDTAVKNAVDNRIPPKVVEDAETARTRAVNAAQDAEDALGRIKSELKDAPAARYQQTTAGQQLAIGTSRPVGTVIDFSHKDYDTHGAVTPGASWHFKAPKAGIYSVTAHAGCEQSGGQLTVGLCVGQKPGGTRPNVFLAEAQAYINRTIIGGTTDIELKKDDLVDIRVYAGGVEKSQLVAVGTTEVSIHYVRPPSQEAK